MNRLRPYAQLVRLPNLPSALADVGLGAMATGAWAESRLWPAYLLLMFASAGLYSGGMAWNDFFDREEDRSERPDRPIPSGKVTPRQAALFATGLVVAGVLFAFLAGLVLGRWATTLTLALLLTGAIFLYDAWLKHTVVGPVGMGACRSFNVLLGMAPAAADVFWSRGLYLAVLVGLYIVGVTWLARTEARVSSRAALAAAGVVMAFALAMALPLPVAALPTAPPAEASSPLFPYLLAGLGFFVGFPVVRAIRAPTPPRVQAAVKRSLMGLILLDTVLATALAGTVGLALMVLMAPSFYLNRRKWLYAT